MTSFRTRSLEATFLSICLVCLLGATFLPSLRAAEEPLPDLPYQELLDLLKAQLVDLDESEFERQAASALLNQFKSRVLFGNRSSHGPFEPDLPNIAARRRLDGPSSYVRVGRVSLGLAPQLNALLHNAEFLDDTKGLILDLRFAGGMDYQAAANTADLFLTQPATFLDWGVAKAQTSPKKKPWDLPVIVLINKHTSAAAEALAAILRVEQVALVIGNVTAGHAAVFQDFTLSNGERLRIATHRVRTSDNHPLPLEGLTPDISVDINPLHERAYLNDPFTPVTGTVSQTRGTNVVVSSLQVRRKVTEAELVQARKEALGALDPTKATTSSERAGGTSESASTNSAAPNDAPLIIVRDPVLARAIDLLNNLAVLRP